MKLNFKDLKHQKFAIDAEPSETIADVKKKVAEERGTDAGSIRLIYSGKILVDTNSVESYNIEEKGYIVYMQQKPKVAPVAKAAPSTPAPAAVQTPQAPGPASQSAAANAPSTPSPAGAAAATPQSERRFDEASSLMGSERQAAVANMESMGFERAEIERAMRAAFFNPDRAVEYLLNGIPANAQQAAAPSTANQPTPQSTAPAAAASAESTPAAADSDEPINLFEAAAAAQGGGNRGAARGATAGGDASAAAGAGAGAGLAGGVPNNSLEFLRDHPAFQQIRGLVQSSPHMLENVLQQLGASNPQLAQLIASNPEQFLQLLAEEGSEGAEAHEGQISVTEEERDAIERLCRLGFNRDLVIQAYFACDKNEELAANFLFDHPDDEQEQQ